VLFKVVNELLYLASAPPDQIALPVEEEPVNEKEVVEVQNEKFVPASTIGVFRTFKTKSLETALHFGKG
jgi:hypothetical protein